MKMNKTQKKVLENLIDKKYLTPREYCDILGAERNEWIKIIESEDNYSIIIYNDIRCTLFV